MCDSTLNSHPRDSDTSLLERLLCTLDIVVALDVDVVILKLLLAP